MKGERGQLKRINILNDAWTDCPAQVSLSTAQVSLGHRGKILICFKVTNKGKGVRIESDVGTPRGSPYG